MSFFREMTFARLMILLCLVSSGVLGYFVYQNHRKILANRDALLAGGQVEQLVRRVQANSKRYSDLYKKKGDETLIGQDSPVTYIRGIAARDNVDIGRVEVDAKPKPLTDGIVDNVFTISPFDRDKLYSRIHIANFLWSLEDQSRRVRITDLKIEATDEEGKQLRKRHEPPSDRWKLSCTVTSRQRKTVQ